MSQGTPSRTIPWHTLQLWAWGIGAAGLLLWAIGWVVAVGGSNDALHRKVFFAYLFAYGFSLSIPLGSLPLWMLHNQTGGAWGLVIRRYLEAATRVIPFMAILFVPILIGLPQLYVWADPDLVPRLYHGPEIAELLHKKGSYLSFPWFFFRTCIYFAVWTLLSWVLNRRQQQLDRDPTNRQLARRQQVLSGPGIVLYGGTMTFAAIDWFMTLEPTWYSTIFGVLVVMGQTLPALAFTIATAAWLLDRKPVTEAETDRDTWNDLGSLLLAAVMLWTYMSFSQLLLIWIGNLPEEITWYYKRSHGGWEYVGWVLGLCYFALPFLLLLSRANKRDPRKLMKIACLLIILDVVHYFWLVNPVYAAILKLDLENGGPFVIEWPDFAALFGLGGVTFGLFLWQLRTHSLAPPPMPLAEAEAEQAQPASSA
jgi:hypothetical protein